MIASYLPTPGNVAGGPGVTDTVFDVGDVEVAGEYRGFSITTPSERRVARYLVGFGDLPLVSIVMERSAVVATNVSRVICFVVLETGVLAVDRMMKIKGNIGSLLVRGGGQGSLIWMRRYRPFV